MSVYWEPVPKRGQCNSSGFLVRFRMSMIFSCYYRTSIRAVRVSRHVIFAVTSSKLSNIIIVFLYLVFQKMT